MRIPFDELKATFEEILKSRGIKEETARISAENFAASSADGVYTHGVNRFPKVISYLERGLINGNGEPERVFSMGAVERWDGHMGLGNVNAKKAMDRACGLASLHGIAMVALKNTSHWMRGGAYGWQAAERGFIGFCWTNSMPNMPPWGGTDPRLGNNPLVIAVPSPDRNHAVIDIAMSQFSYGKIELARLKGETLPVPGGWNKGGALTCDPKEVEESRLVFPMGYWKGSGLSVLLDIAAAVLSGGRTVKEIGEAFGEDAGVSQIFIAMKPEPEALKAVTRVLEDVKASAPREDGSVFYPGEIEKNTRKENMERGIPVLDTVWETIQALKKGGSHG